MSSRVNQRFPSEKEQEDDTRDAAGNSITAPAVPMSVVYKLLFFTFAMITLPIGTYFATVHTIFRGSSTYAGAMAAVMANVVLIAYVLVAYNEDEGDQPASTSTAAGTKGKKAE